MTVIEMINRDNEELSNRLSRHIDLDDLSEELGEFRLWCLDVISSGDAKEKVLYRRIEDINNLSPEIKSSLDTVRESSQNLQKVIEELMARDPNDNAWSTWLSSAQNLIRAKSLEEGQLLELIPEVFSDKDLRQMTTEFERAREYSEEIGKFQFESTPLRQAPRPDART